MIEDLLIVLVSVPKLYIYNGFNINEIVPGTLLRYSSTNLVSSAKLVFSSKWHCVAILAL